MELKPGLPTVAATVVAGATAEVLWQQVGVIAVGALGGAFWALMQLNAETTRLRGLRFMASRLAFSFCLTWVPAMAAQSWLEDHAYKVPVTAAMLGVSFVLACVKELTAEFPALSKIGGLFRKE